MSQAVESFGPVGGGGEKSPLVSIVVPSLNEETTIGEFVEWCWQGLAEAGVTGEVLIVDSSTDRTPEIAESKGARVLRTPRRGLGRAYIDAIPHIRGRYVIMGDCDLTYDFRKLKPFIDALDAGHEFVMGNRLKGQIDPGAMPALHRYFGTPLTTWILNRMYRSPFGDIHCGMRAMPLEALKRIGLESQSWEYASEMVLKAARLKLKSAELPIVFHKDPPGRTSHMKRGGWLSPWRAGWINLKVMFLYAPDFFLLRPGVALFALGLLLTLLLVGGLANIGPVRLSLNSMLLGVTMCSIGYTSIQLALLARVYHGFNPEYARRLVRLFSYNRGMLLSAALMVPGLVLGAVLFFAWIHQGLTLATEQSYRGVFGLLLIILGFETFTFTLLLHMVAGTLRHPR